MDFLLVASGWHIMFNHQIIEELLESDEEDEDCIIPAKRRRLSKAEGSFEHVIPQLNDTCFQVYFRLSRTTVEWLTTELSPFLLQFVDQNHVSGRKTVEPQKKILMTIWLLGNQESLSSVADRFGVCKSTLNKMSEQVVQSLLVCNAANGIIKWPSAQQRKTVETAFYEAHRMPGVIGCVDACHITIKAPPTDTEAFYNQKGFYSVVLQGVCDNKLRFTDIYVGEPGSLHDAAVLERSPLCMKLSSNSAEFFGGDSYHLLGDLAYPLMVHLMVEFRSDNKLTVQQARFNKVLSAARSHIDRAFEQLKERFRRLKFLDMNRQDLIPKHIMACCILHNLCLQQESGTSQQLLEPITCILPISNQLATTKRIMLMNKIMERYH